MVIGFAGSLAVWGVPSRLGRGGSAVVEIFGRGYTEGELNQVRYRRERALGVDGLKEEQLLDFLTMLAEAERLGVTVSDAQVRSAGASVFGQQGEISLSGYRLAVSRRMGLPEKRAVEQFEAAMRDELMVNTLTYLALGDVPVTDEEAYCAYLQQNEEIKLRYAAFPAEEIAKEMEVAEREIRERYEEHRKEYFDPERAAVEYISVVYGKVKDDIEVTEEEIAEYYEENKEMFVEDPAAATTDPAEVETEPTYRALEDVKESIKTILGSQKTTEETERRIKDASAEIDLWYEARDSDPDNTPKLNFDELASKYKLDYGKTELFDEANPAGAIARIEGAASYAVTHSVGDISGILEGIGQKMIVRVAERQPQRQLSLKEVSEEILEEIRGEKGKEKAGGLAAAFAEAARDSGLDKGLEAMADEDRGKVKIGETEFFPRPSIFSFRAQTIPGLGLKPKIIEAVKGLELGKASEAVEESEGFYVVAISGTKPASPGGFEEKRELLASIIKQWKRLELFRAWQDSLRQRAEIKDLTKLEGK